MQIKKEKTFTGICKRESSQISYLFDILKQYQAIPYCFSVFLITVDLHVINAHQIGIKLSLISTN